jgi:hypothetical protein
MRRLLIITLLVLLAAPTAALAFGRAPGDGTLALVSPTIDDCDALGVWGADRSGSRSLRDGTTTCVFASLLTTREAIRFRLVLGPDESLVVRNGNGLSLSAVGQGTGTIKGVGGFDGVFSLNGGLFRSLPDTGLTFALGARLP